MNKRGKGTGGTGGRRRRGYRAAAIAVDTPAEVVQPRPFESIFSGSRPQVISRGFDPVFLLVDRGLMEQLRATALRRGIESDYLLRQILREHIGEY